MTKESRWDQNSRIWEIAYTQFLDGLCECGVPREVCMDPDPNKAWLVDFRVGYRCKALEHAQQVKADEDQRVRDAGAKVYPQSRKWTATEYREGPDHGGQDSHSPVHS